MRFLAMLLLVVACSTHEKKTVKKPDLLKECLFKEVGDWEDTSHNFDCISKIHHSVDSLLRQGNSPQALRLSRMGMVQYPFDDRIKNQFQKVADVYKAVTLKLSDCDQVKERILFLRSVSPDSEFQHETCPVPSSTNRIAIDDITYLRAAKKIEVQEFKNISGELKYVVKKNTEDNFDNILYKGLESVDVIHKSVSFDVSDATDENNFTLKVETKVLMDQKIDETCQELSVAYHYPEGYAFPCGVKTKHQLFLGKLDFENLSKLHAEKSLMYGFIPTNSIFVVEFHYAQNKKTFYYFDNAFDEDKYPGLDAETPVLEGIKKKNGYTYRFHHLKSTDVEGLKQITFSFNRLLTFEVYSQAVKDKKEILSLWQEVVKKHTLVIPAKSNK
jgi:hypothetical protein